MVGVELKTCTHVQCMCTCRTGGGSLEVRMNELEDSVTVLIRRSVGLASGRMAIWHRLCQQSASSRTFCMEGTHGMDVEEDGDGDTCLGRR